MRLSDHPLFKHGWPTILQDNAAVVGTLLEQMEASQWLPPGQIVQNQLAQLVELATHAEKHSVFFKTKMQKAGLAPADFTSLEAFRQLPLLTRRDIQTAGKSLFCTTLPPCHEPTSEVSTSGSTGEPVRILKTPVSAMFWLALTLREGLWNGWDYSQRIVFIRAHIEKPAMYANWGPPVDYFFRSGEACHLPSAMDIGEQVKLIRQWKPGALLTYPTNLAGLIDKDRDALRELKFIWTVGENLSPQLRVQAEALAGRVYDNYSTQEVGVIAIQCPESSCYHLMSENLLVELLDEQGNPCREGEIGRIVITDLHNFATPVIRYALGDYAEMAGACACGRGLGAFKRILGRERNLVIKPDGTRNWPLLGFAKFRDIAPIFQYQFIQHDLNNVEMRLVVERKLTKKEEAALTALIQESLGYPFALRFTYFSDRLPTGAGGKLEEFVCRI